MSAFRVAKRVGHFAIVNDDGFGVNQTVAVFFFDRGLSADDAAGFARSCCEVMNDEAAHRAKMEQPSPFVAHPALDVMPPSQEERRKR